MSDNHIKRIEVRRLHGVFDLDHEFNHGVNIIYGHNGAGKTTTLHILSNAMTGDIDRFFFLQFDNIAIELYGGDCLSIARERVDQFTVEIEVQHNGVRTSRLRGVFQPADDKPPSGAFTVPRVRRPPGEASLRTVKPLATVAYFPAFRSMLDAWSSAVRDGHLRPYQRERTPTDLARRLFGQFVPGLTYRSLLDIEKRLGDQVRAARLTAANAESDEMRRMVKTVFAEASTDRQVSMAVRPAPAL